MVYTNKDAPGVGHCRPELEDLIFVEHASLYSVAMATATRVELDEALGLFATTKVCQSKLKVSGRPMWLIVENVLVDQVNGAWLSTVGPDLARTCMPPCCAFIQLAEETFASMAPLALSAEKGPVDRSMRDAMASSAHPFDSGSVWNLLLWMMDCMSPMLATFGASRANSSARKLLSYDHRYSAHVARTEKEMKRVETDEHTSHQATGGAGGAKAASLQRSSLLPASERRDCLLSLPPPHDPYCLTKDSYPRMLQRSGK